MTCVTGSRVKRERRKDADGQDSRDDRGEKHQREVRRPARMGLERARSTQRFREPGDEATDHDESNGDRGGHQRRNSARRGTSHARQAERGEYLLIGHGASVVTGRGLHERDDAGDRRDQGGHEETADLEARCCCQLGASRRGRIEGDRRQRCVGRQLDVGRKPLRAVRERGDVSLPVPQAHDLSDARRERVGMRVDECGARDDWRVSLFGTWDPNRADDAEVDVRSAADEWLVGRELVELLASQELQWEDVAGADVEVARRRLDHDDLVGRVGARQATLYNDGVEHFARLRAPDDRDVHHLVEVEASDGERRRAALADLRELGDPGGELGRRRLVGANDDASRASSAFVARSRRAYAVSVRRATASALPIAAPARPPITPRSASWNRLRRTSACATVQIADTGPECQEPRFRRSGVLYRPTRPRQWVRRVASEWARSRAGASLRRPRSLGRRAAERDVGKSGRPLRRG